MPPNVPTFGSSRAPIVDKDGNPSRDYLKKMQEWDQKLASALTLLGQINASAVIQGRTEGIGTTVTNLNVTGQLKTADNIAADGVTFGRVVVSALTSGQPDLGKPGVIGKTTDNLADGTGSPLTGGKRAAVALDTNNRLANSFRNTSVNVSAAPLSGTVLSNTGAVTAITVNASSFQYAAGAVAYNSGSVDPGVFGAGISMFVYADDPTFAGGAVTYVVTIHQQDQVAAEGRLIFGSIPTQNGVATTGGGFTGGNGSTGGRGFYKS